MTKSMQEIAEFLYNEGYFGTTLQTQEFFTMLMQYCSELETRIQELENKLDTKIHNNT